MLSCRFFLLHAPTIASKKNHAPTVIFLPPNLSFPFAFPSPNRDRLGFLSPRPPSLDHVIPSPSATSHCRLPVTLDASLYSLSIMPCQMCRYTFHGRDRLVSGVICNCSIFVYVCVWSYFRVFFFHFLVFFVVTMFCSTFSFFVFYRSFIFLLLVTSLCFPSLFGFCFDPY